MNQKIYLNYGRLFFGLLGLSAIITEIAVLVDRGVFEPLNFFSYFTILSNLAAVLFLILYSHSPKLSRKQGRLISLIRGGVTLYMGMTGVIFAILLAGIEGATLTAVPWDNLVLHYIMPLVVVLDWIINPPKEAISFKASLAWLLFPLSYVVYSLLRGAAVNWYPYPFLNPTNHGYSQVLSTSLILLIGVLAANWLLTKRASR